MRSAIRLCVVVSLFALPVLAQNADVTGSWSGTYTLKQGSCPATSNSASAAFVQSGTSVVGYVVLTNVPMDTTDAPECKVTRSGTVTLPVRGTVSGSTFSGAVTVPGDTGPIDAPFSATINGESTTIAVGGGDFSLSISINRTSKTPPDLGLTGSYSGTYTSVFLPCSKPPAITYSGSVSGTLTQVGNAVSGVFTASNLKRDEEQMNGTCLITDASNVPATLEGQINGNTITGTVGPPGEANPFTATVNGNTITGQAAGQPGESFSFTITKTSGGGPGPTQPSITSFTANPQSISAGQTSTLSWTTTNATSVTIDNGVGSVGTSGSVTVKPAATTTYTLTATGSGGSATRTTTVTVASAGTPRVIVSAFPRGLLQPAGEGGAVDSFSLTNIGDGATNVTLSGSGGFFTINASSLTLGPNESATVSVTGVAQPAGTYNGTVTVSGNGASGVVIPIRLLSVVPETSRVIAAPAVARSDVASNPGQTATSSVNFTNSGSGTLVALPVADVPWITPQSGPVTIPPGATQSISYTVDSNKRPDADSPLGTAQGKISLPFFTGAPGPTAFATGTTPTSTVSVSVAYVVNPNVAAGSPPALNGQLAYFIPALGNRNRATGDLLLASRNASPLTDLKLYVLRGTTTQTASISQLLPNTSVAFTGLLKNVFASPSPSASVQVRTADLSKVTVAATQSNTANASATYTALPVFRSDRGTASGAGQIVLGGLLKSDTSLTDIFVQEMSGNAGNFNLDFLDASGRVINSQAATSLGPFAFAEMQDAAPAGAASARVSSASGTSISLAAYALVRDLTSGDTWMITDPGADAASDTFFVPLLSAGNGATTSVFVTSRSSSPVSVTTETHGGAGRRRSVNGVNATTTATASLQPGQTSTTALKNVSFGYMKIVAPQRSVSIAARSTTSIGSSLPPLPASAAIGSGTSKRFGGVEDASQESRARAVPSTFRTNLALIETSNAQVTVRVTLQYSFPASNLVSARGTSSKEFTIDPSGFLLITDVARQLLGAGRDSVGDLHNMVLDVEVVRGSGRVLPYLQSFDNASGDMIVRSD